MFRQAFHTVMARCLVTLLMIVQSSLWTRLLLPEGRGLYAKLQATNSLLILLLGFGLTSGIVYFISRDRERSRQLWTLSLFITFAGTVVGLGLVAAVKLWPAMDFIFPAGYASVFFSTYFLLTFMQSQIQLTINAFLAADQRFGNLNQIEIFSSLIRLGLIAFAYFRIDQPSFETLFALDLGAQFIRTLIYFYFFRRVPFSRTPIAISRADVTPVLRYSIALYSLALIQFLYQRIDIWFIERQNGIAALGLFASALGLAQYLTILPVALNTVLVPSLASKNLEEASRDLAKYSRANWFLLLFPTAAFIFVPEFILKTLFGVAFTSASTSLRILGVAYWFAASKHILIYFNASQNRLRINFLIEAAGLVIGLALNVLLIPPYGIAGAAYAFLVTSVVTYLGCYFSVLQDIAKPRIHFFFPTIEDFKSLRSLVSR